MGSYLGVSLIDRMVGWVSVWLQDGCCASRYVDVCGVTRLSLRYIRTCSPGESLFSSHLRI